MARTGKKLADSKLANPLLTTVDIRGNTATNGEYLFPFGVNLGGIAFPEMNEIDLNALGIPFSFSGIPWNLDRRLSPGGCIGNCESTPQPLNPFPFEELDPRTLANVPATQPILSFFPFGGGDTLAWPPKTPGFFGIAPTPPLTQVCGGAAAVTTSSVSGEVNGIGFRNVTLTLTGGPTAITKTTRTDFTGNFVFAGLANGTYTLTPKKNTLTFTPASVPVNITAPGAITGLDFTIP
jgi:hypothetical protein